MPLRFFLAATVFGSVVWAGMPGTLVHPGIKIKPIPLGGKTFNVTGISFFPDGKMLLATTDFMGGGEVPDSSATSAAWIVTGAQGDFSTTSIYKVADYFRQPSGTVITPDGKGYVVDRDGFYELLNLNTPVATKTNRKKVVNFPWEGAPNTEFLKTPAWHQWVFTPVYLKDRFWAPYSGTIGSGGQSNAPQSSPYSGAMLSWKADSYDQPYTAMEKVAGGLRSPNGCNTDSDGNIYFTDNQGSFLPASVFTRLVKGKFYGHKQLDYAPNWAESLPYEPPTAWLPHMDARRSPTQPLFIDRGFYRGDWIIGDVNDSSLIRVGIDKVDKDNEKQNGSVFFFTGGFDGVAINRMAWNSQENSVVIGSFGVKNGNWPDVFQTQPLLAMTISDTMDVFEMQGIYSRKGGLEIRFTQPLDTTTVKVSHIRVTQWEYQRTGDYWCCPIAQDIGKVSVTREIQDLRFSKDGRRIYLQLDSLMNNHPFADSTRDWETRIHLNGMLSKKGLSLFYNDAWFTPNYQSREVFDSNVTVAQITASKSPRLAQAIQWARVGHTLTVSVALSEPFQVTLTDAKGKALLFSKTQRSGKWTATLPNTQGLQILSLRTKSESFSRVLPF